MAGVSYDEISEILKIIDASSCEEFVLETDAIKLVVRRRGPGGIEAASPPSPPSMAGTARFAGPAPSTEPAKSKGRTAEVTAGDGTVVTAPMVGTFYRAPAPGAPPFVEIGAQVKTGDPLCLIEVMKLFTTICAERDGRIAEIGANNGELVEYGQMLFVIAG